MADNNDSSRNTGNHKGDEKPDKGRGLFPWNNNNFNFSIWYFVGALALLFLLNLLFSQPSRQVIDYSAFKDRIESGQIRRVEMRENYFLGYPNTAETTQSQDPLSLGEEPLVYRTVPVNDPGLIELMDENGVEYYAVPPSNTGIFYLILNWALPFIILIIVWRFMMRRMGDMGQGVMTFGKNKSQIVAEGSTNVTFADVAGADEAKEELEEVVDFLKDQRKYTSIGGKIPKGVLLVGAPGTGKTLLARAVAGTAGVPFFRMSGADFVEMFVGVGASRVRDLFKQAREKAPCIIFVDELDAIGKSRIAGGIGGNDEREQTLNQLLVEMDGFDATSGVIILAATNRPEILDPALLRPGRFDRQVVVDKPDLDGREKILKIHSKDVKLDPTVDIKDVARATPGFVGADLANIVNEAAILAVRGGRKTVLQEDFDEAIEKSMAGLQKKNRLINKKERNVVAYHETGHALIAAFTDGADPVRKITIVPRGLGALGYTLQMPTEDKFLLEEGELLGKIDVLLGGRAAERVIFGKISTGAANDLTKATDIARKMITEYGMSEKFHNVALTTQRTPFLGENAAPGMNQRDYSESTQQYIDEEVARVINGRYSHVLDLLQEKRDLLESITARLLDKETIEAEEFRNLIKDNGSEDTKSESEKPSGSDS